MRGPAGYKTAATMRSMSPGSWSMASIRVSSCAVDALAIGQLPSLTSIQSGVSTRHTYSDGEDNHRDTNVRGEEHTWQTAALRSGSQVFLVQGKARFQR